MINAKEELLKHIGSRTIKCATISDCSDWRNDDVMIELKCGYTKSQYTRFEARLNFEYSNGYGKQNLYGTIWYTDGTWSERGEYDDGSEWWEHRCVPQIPTELRYGA
jgi:hypothetical protein